MNRFTKIFVGLAMINAIVHLLCHPWHGTALNGKEDAGRYYLGSHGNYWEVSPSTFRYCIWQEYSTGATLLLMFASMWLLPRKKEERSSHAV